LSFFFFFFFVSHEYRCFSIWSYKCSLKHSREKKNWPFLLLIVFVEWTFLTLIRGDFAAFFLLSLFFDVSQPIYFTFFLSLRKNSLSSNLNKKRSSFLCVFYWSYRLPDVIIVLYIVHLIEGRSYESLLNNEISCNWE